MAYPTLKFPAPHGKMDARRKYELGLLDPHGFAAAYFEAVKDAERHINTNFSFSHYGFDVKRHALEGACKNFNQEHDKMRQYIARKLQRYLLTHDGRIDMWPDDAGNMVLSFEGRKAYFHYFSKNYYVGHSEIDDEYDTLEQHKPILTYRSGFVSDIHPGSAAHKPEEKSAEMKEKVKKLEEMAKHTHNDFVASLVGGILLIFVILSLLSSLFFKTGGPVIWVLTILSNGFLKAPPGPVLHILCMAICLLGIWGCVGQYLTYRDFKRDFEKAEQEYSAYMKNDFQRQKEEDETQKAEQERARAEDIAFAEEWQRAWFEWFKSAR